MTRPDLFVYLTLAAAWIVVAAWVCRIGRKADRLRATMEEAGVGGYTSSDAT